jgi:hypothetical protein
MLRSASVLVWIEQLVLGQRDRDLYLGRTGLAALGQRLLNAGALLVGEDPVDHSAHVALVVDRVLLGAPEQVGVLAQQSGAHRVERGRCDAPRLVLAEQVSQPQTQLARGTDAERDRENLARLRCAGDQQVRDPVRQGSCFAGPWTSDQQQRAGAVGNSLRLLRRETSEQALGSGRRVCAPLRVGMRHPSPPSVSRWIDQALRLRTLLLRFG